MYLDKAKKEEIFSKYGKSCTTAISIATVPSSRPSVSASNLEQFAKKNKTSHRSKEHWEVSLFYMIQPIPSFSPRLMEFFNF